jgi:5-methylcytosine-specific restriction endonuclease McrA
VEKPGREPRPAKPDHIPAEVKRAVWVRDGGCCQWALENGGVCGSKHRLQFDHIRPKAQGGASTVDNVRVLCASHNLRAARIAFGDAWIDRFTSRPPPTAAAALPERGRPKPSAR